MKSARIVLGLFLAACSADLPHQSQFDPDSPESKQAKAQVLGTVSLEGETDFAQVSVELQNANRTYNVDTKADGSFRVTGVVPGKYRLSMGTRYFEPSENDLEIGLGELVNLEPRKLKAKRSPVQGSALVERLEEGGLITEGSVLIKLVWRSSIRSAGSNAPSLRVSAEDATGGTSYTTMSSDDGSYSLNDVPAGEYDVFASSSGVESQTTGQVSVTGEETAVVEDILLKPLSGFFTVVGKVFDPFTAQLIDSNRYTKVTDVTVRFTMSNAVKMQVGASGPGAACLVGPEETFNASRVVGLSGEGLNTVCAVFVDETGKKTEPSYASIMFDKTPPIFPSVVASNGAAVTANNLISVALSAVDPISGLDQMVIASDAAFVGAVAQSYVPGLAYTLDNFGAVNDGAYGIYAKFYDKAGNVSAVTSADIFLDTQPPSGPLADLLTSTGGLITTGLVIRDSRIELSSIVIDDTALQMQVSTGSNFVGVPWETYTNSKFIDLALPAGYLPETRTVRAQVRDAAGHILDLGVVTFDLDTRAPLGSVTLISPALAKSLTVSLNLSANEPASQAQISVDPGFSGASWFDTANTTYTLPAGEGSRTIYARFRDAAGNVTPAQTIALVVDTLAPQLTGFTVDTGSYTTQIVNHLTFTGIDAVNVRVQEGSCGGTYLPNTGGLNFTFASGGQGPKTIFVQFSDAAGNETTPCLSKTVTLDSVAPTFTSGKGIVIDQDAIHTFNRVVGLALNITGATEVIVSENSTFTGAAWQPAVTNMTWTLSAGESVKTVYMQARDAAGNLTPLQSDSISVDTLAPNFNAFAAPAQTTSATPSLALTGSGADLMRISENADFSGASWVAFVPTTVLAQPLAGEGAHTIYAQLSDAAGNLSIVRSAVTMLDSQAPLAPVISVTAGGFTKVQAVNVQVLVDGAAEIQLSESSIFAGASWQPYSVVKTFTLSSGDALKRIYVRARDTAGNMGPAASASVTLDQTPPSVLLYRAEDLAGSPISQTNQLRFYLRLSVTDATPVTVQFSPSGVFAGVQPEAVQNSRAWDVFPPSAANGENRAVYAKIIDSAGNESTVGPVTVLVDNLAPSGLSMTPAANLVSTTTVALTLGASNASWVELSEDVSFLTQTAFPYSASVNYSFVSSSDGVKTLYARFADSLGNYSSIVGANIILDRTPPSNTSFTILQGSMTNVSTLSLALFAVGAESMSVSEDTCSANWGPYNQAKAYPLANTAPGVKVIAVQYKDLAGNPSACITHDITFDNAPPQLLATPVQINYGQASTSSPVVTLAFQVSGADFVRVSEDVSFADMSWQPYSATRTFSLSYGNELKTVYVQFRDAAGNETATLAVEITLDNTPPSAPFLTIAGDVTTNRLVSLNLGASNIQQMMVSESPVFAGANWVPYFANTTTQLTDVDGAHTVYAKFRKSSGIETTVASDTIILDRAGPLLPSVRINNGATVTGSNVVTLSLAGIDTVSGLSTYKVSAVNDFSGATERAFTSTDVLSLDPVDGAHTVWVIIGDRAGNYSAPASAAVLLDRAAPVVNSAGLQTLGGTVVTNGNTVRDGRLLLVSNVDDITPLEIQVTTSGNFTGAAWVPYNGTYVLDLLSSPSSVAAKVRDGAGLVTDLLSAVTVNLDTQPPTSNSLAINGNAAYTNDPLVTLTLGSIDADKMRVSENSDFSGASWVDYAVNESLTLSGADGAKVVYAQFRDLAGNESVAVSKLIQLDTQAPAGVNLIVNNGAAWAVNSGVTLAIAGAGATEMQVGESPTFSGAVWSPFATVYSYSITGGDGLRTVRVRLRDQAGNVSSAAVDQIGLDTTVPTGASVVINEKPTNNTVVKLTMLASGATQMMVGDDAAFTGRTWQPCTTSTAWALPAGDGLKSVFAKFRDQAGNETAAVFDQTSLDTVGPTLINPAVQVNGGATYIKSETVSITVRYVDAVTAVVGEDIAVAFPIASVTLPGGGIHTFNATLSANEGTKNVYVKFYDGAGNPIVQGVSAVLDKTPPSGGQVIIDGGVAWNNSAAGSSTLSLSAFDGGSGVTQVRISNTNADADLDGASAQAFAPAKSWTLASPGAGIESSRSVYVKFVDGAGNESAAVLSDSIGYDTLAPAAGAWSFRIGNADYTTVQSNTLSIAATGATEMIVSPDTLFNGAAWEPFATARTWTFASGGDGVLQTLHVKFRDAAGNATAFFSDSITIDTQAPGGVSMLLDGGAEYGGTPQPTYTRDAELSVSLAGSNWLVAEVSDDVGFQSIIGSFSPATLFPQVINLSANNQADGLKTIYARFRDSAGNVSTLVSRTILLDTSKPSPAAVVINGGAVSTNVVNGIVTLALTAGDSGSGVGNMRIAHTLFDLAMAADEPFNGSKLWTVFDPGGDKEYTAEVYYQVADKAGNWADPVVDQITYDTLAPVTGFAPIVFPGSQPSRFRNQTVHFDVVGASEMLLGNDSSFTARTWEPFAYERQWTFPGGGDDVEYSLYVTFRDTAGNQTSILDEGFFIDDVAPSAPALTLTGGQEYGMSQNADYSRDSEFYLTAAATNWDHAELAYDPAFGNIFNVVTFNDPMPIQQNSPFYDGLFSIYARFYDVAGNVSTVAYDSLIVDSAAPYLTALYVDGHDLFVNPWLNGPWAVTSETGTYTLNIAASDYGTGVVDETVEEGGVQVDLDFQPQPKILTLTNPGPGHSETRYVNVTVRDAAGNSDQRNISFQYRTQIPSFQRPNFVDSLGNQVWMLNSRDTKVKFQNAYEITSYQLSDDPYFAGAVWVNRSSGDPYCPYCFNSDFTVPYTLAAVAPTWTPGPTVPYTPPPSPPPGQPEQRMLFVRMRNMYGLTSQLDRVDPTSVMLDTYAPLPPVITMTNNYLQFPTASFNYTIPSNPPTDDYDRMEADTDSLFAPYSMYDSKSINPQFYGVSWPFPYSNNGNLTLPGSLPDGVTTLYFRTLDTAGNASTLAQVSVTIDTMPPILSVATVNGGATVTNSPVLSVVSSAADPANYYNGGPASGLDRLAVMQGQYDSCQNAAYGFGTSSVPYAASASITPGWIFGDGFYTVYLCVTDKAHNQSESYAFPIAYSFELDTDDPNGLTFEPAFPGSSTNSVNARLRATSSDIGPTEVQISNEPLFIGAVWQPTGTSISWLLTSGDGDKTVYAKFRDPAGNVSATQTTIITLDSTPPQAGSLVVNSGASVTNSTLLQFTLSATESLSMPLEMQFGSDPGFGGATWQTYGTSGSVSIPPGDGFRTLYVRFRDALGNVSPASSASFSMDQSGPLLSYLLVNNGQAYAGNSLPINLQIGNWASGDRVQVATASNFAGYTLYTAAAGANNLTYTLGGAQGSMTLYIRGLDSLGNFGTVYETDITKDTVAPVITVFRAEDGSNNVITTTRQLTYTLRLTASDSAPITVQYSPTNSFSGVPSEAYLTTRQWSVTPPVTPTGENRLTYVRVSDAAGNSVTQGPVTVLVDTMGPSSVNVVVPSTTNSLTVPVNLSALYANFVELSEDISFLTPTVLTMQASTTHTFSGVDDVKYLYVRYSDAVGNYSDIVSGATSVDTEAPTGADFTITEAPVTPLTTVHLTLTASGATEMQISEGGCVGTWESYTTSASYDLSSVQDGVKSISVRFRDDAGNLTSCITKDVTFDSTAPFITTLGPRSGSAGREITVNGINFGAPGTVTIAGVSCPIVTWSNTEITLTVPAGAVAGQTFLILASGGSGKLAHAGFNVLPSIITVNPTRGIVDTAITVTGTGFGSSGTLSIGGIVATTSAWYNTAVTGTVPTVGAGPRQVTVTSNGASAASTVYFVVTPTISGVSPISGAAGATITITGTRFGTTQDTSTVTIGGQPATINSWTDTSISATMASGLPAGAQEVRVIVRSTAATSTYTVNTPWIASRSPISGILGTTVTLGGANFGATSNTVRIDEISATITAWSDTSISFTVPAGLTNGDKDIYVIGPAAFVSNKVIFRFRASDAWWTGGDRLPPRYEHTAVWTGSEMIVWGGTTGAATVAADGGRYNPTTDSWMALPSASAPLKRQSHVAVWTGKVMIVWAGLDGSTYYNTGGRFSPVTNAWTATSTVGAPLARKSPSAVWTGSKMVVFGGADGVGTFASGGLYDPVADNWVATNTGANAPSARWKHAAVWTGKEMLVWGGTGMPTLYSNGAKFYPVANTWSAMSAAPLSARSSHAAVWTGAEMVVFGGNDMGAPTNQRSDGARYNPETDLWAVISTANGPTVREQTSAVWTGTYMVVWGGFNGTAAINTGGRYNVATDTWASVVTGAAPAARYGHTAVWTGTEMIAWGGYSGSVRWNDGGRYNAAANTWTPINTQSPTPINNRTTVYTGTEIISWGGNNGATFYNAGERYDPATDRIRPMSTTSAPAARNNSKGVWTGSVAIFWGGWNGARLNTGGRYNPSTDSWAATGTGANEPGARSEHHAVWASSVSRMIIYGGYKQGTGWTNTGSRYDPVGDAWIANTTVNAPPAAMQYGQSTIWTGTRMIATGGTDYWFTNPVNVIYNPAIAGDSWTTGAGTMPRSHHAAVWTGTRMLIFGGYNYIGAGGWYSLNTGESYDPVGDSWSVMTTTGAPTVRGEMSYAWAGSRLVVWGGQETYDDGGGFNYTSIQTGGGRYNPGANTWAGMTTTGQPTPAINLGAFGIANEMIIYQNGVLGRYTP